MDKLKLLSILLLLITSTGCDQNEKLSECEIEDNCENLQIVDELFNEKAKVIEINGQFVLTTDSISLANPGYRIGSNNILVPCEFMPESLKIDERLVIISGYKTNCCNQITLPTLRNSFGCKLKITSIDPLTDNS